MSLSEEVKTLRKTVEQAVRPGNFKRRYKRDPIRFWRIVLLTRCSHVITPQLTGDVLTRSYYCRFSQFWLIFPNGNYQPRSI